MKAKGKLKLALFTTGLALISGAVVLGHISNVSEALADSVSDLFVHDPTHSEADWYTLDVNPEDETFKLYMSPLPSDYRGLSKSSLNNFSTNSINGLKDIITSQITFIKPVAQTDRKEGEDWSLNTTEEVRPSVINALIEGVLRDEEMIVVEENVDEFDYTIENGNVGLSTDSGSFLRTMVSYVAAFGVGAPSESDKIPSRLGVSVDSSGNVTPVLGSTTYDQFYNVYSEMGYDPTICESKALKDLQVIYDDAVGINQSAVVQTEALVKILDGLEDTNVPVKTAINILGAENVLNGVKSIFTNQDVDIEYGKHFLNELDQRTMNDVCDIIQLELYDPETGTGGFTKQDLLDAFELSTNSRLMQIFDGLEPNGLNNIRIILGKPVDYSGGFTPTDPEQYLSRSLHRPRRSSQQASTSDYAEFGSELMQIMMERLALNDLLIGTKELTIVYNGERYKILYHEDNGDGTTSNLILGVHALVDLVNALPKMSDIRNTPDQDMKLNFDIELITALNDREIEIDEVTKEVISDDFVPIYIHTELGFQEKDCKYIRKLAALLDDTFDLEFDFEDDGEFWFNLTTRNPRFISNIYAWLCDSGFIQNNDDRKLLVELWDLAFSDLKDIRDYIQTKEVEDIIEDLENIDYEVAFATLTSATELNEIFEISQVTSERIDRAIGSFIRLARKAGNTSYQDIVDFVAGINEGIATKLDNATLENIYSKVQSLLNKIVEKNVSVEMLQGITNNSVYDYVRRLSGKSDLILKIRDKVVNLINALPEEYLDNSLMDFYQGNGDFRGNGSFDIRWEQMIKRLPNGDNAWIAFDGMIPEATERPLVLSFNLDSTFEDLYSITYEWNDGEDSKTGMLHTGSDVMLFGGRDSDDVGTISHWIDKNADEFTRVDEMVDYDVVVVPEYLYEVEISGDIEKVYDGTGSLEITVSAEYLNEYTMTYQWQHFVDDAWKDIAGETSDSIEVPNVLDSGDYRCVVNNGDKEVISGSANVEITPKPVDVTVVEWDDVGPFKYTGDEISVAIDESTIPEGATFAGYDGEYAATEVGEYTAIAKFSLSDENNYVFKDDVDQITLADWKIKMNVIEFEAEWLDDYDFEYDGEEHHNIIDPESYPSDKFTLTYETKLNTEEDTAYVDGGRIEIGEYVTKAIFTPLDPSYEMKENAVPEPKLFTIYRNVDLSDLEWSYHTEFTYDGAAHNVYVKNVDTIPEILSMSYETTFDDGSVSSNERTDVGEYQTVANVNFADGYNSNIIRFTNDSVTGISNARDWSISSAVILVDHVEWDYDEPFTFDEETTYSVDLIDGCLPEQVGYQFVSGSENSASNAGTYTAEIEIFIKPEYADNYILDPNSTTTYTCTWKINPKTISLENVVWSDENSGLTYNGSSQSTTITSADNLDKATITYDNNENTNAGSYMATATIVSNDSNYVFDTPSVSHMYTIDKKEVSVTSVTWTTPSEYTYDKNEHSLEVSEVVYSEDGVIDYEYLTDNSATNAGNYTVKVEFFLLDSDNYVLVGETNYQSVLVINPKQVSSSEIVTWTTTAGDNYVYDGTSHEVTASINSEYEGDFTLGYIHNSDMTHEATEAGEYTAKVVCSITESEAGNYVITDTDGFTYEWSITAKTIYVSNVTWTNGNLVYNGNEQTVSATYDVSNDLDQLEITFNGDSGTNAGSYEATLDIVLLDTDNYVLVVDDEDALTYEWSISKKEIVVSNVTWTSDDLVYNGSEQGVNVTYDISNDTDKVDVSITGDTATNAGDNYNAEISFTLLDNENYTLVISETEPLSFAWAIKKAEITVSSLTWNYNEPYVYDGLEHDVYILEEFPEQVEITYDGDENAINAGEYYIEANISIKDEYTDNYVLTIDSLTSSSLDWVINKKHVSVGTVTWSGSEFTYNGSEQSVTVVSFDNMDVITLGEVTNNSATNAGSYEATATFMLNDSDNYILDDPTCTHAFNINKLTISVTTVTWSNGNLTYNGSEQSITLTYENDDLISATVTGNTATNAGNYIAIVDFALVDEDNYELTGITHLEENWSIAKATITVTNITWTDDTTTFVYDGETHETVIESMSNSDYVDIYYFDNVNENAGDYTASAVFVLKDEYKDNYILTNGIESHDYSIAKAQISVSNVTWSYTSPFVEDGSGKEVVVVSYVDSTIIGFDYENGGEYTNQATDAGNYEAKVIFTLNEEFASNYELVGETEFYLNWKITEKEQTFYYTFISYENCDNDQNPYAIVQVTEGITENPELIATLTDGNGFDGANIDFNEIIGSNGKVDYSYDLTFDVDGQEYVFGENEFTTTILIPEDIRNSDFSIIGLNADGSVSKLDFELSDDGKYAVIHGDFAKTIGFVTALAYNNALSNNMHNLVIMLFAVVGQLVFVIATIIVAKKIRKAR